MTYRDAIQIQIKALQEIYDNAGHLRDVASYEAEKEVYNNIRRQLPALWGGLQKIDNNLSVVAARYEVKGDYSIKISVQDI